MHLQLALKWMYMINRYLEPVKLTGELLLRMLFRKEWCQGKSWKEEALKLGGIHQDQRQGKAAGVGKVGKNGQNI